MTSGQDAQAVGPHRSVLGSAWHGFRKVVDSFLEILLTVVMTVLVLDVVWQVVTRFVLRNPSKWTDELATFLMIWVGMLGASVALYRGAHLGIDYFVGKFSELTRMFTEVAVFLLVGLFSLSVMLIGGIQLVANFLDLGQPSPAMGIEMGYVYLALPISGFFLTLYSFELLIEKMIAIFRYRSARLDDMIERGKYSSETVGEE